MKDCEGIMNSTPADQPMELGSEGDFIFVRLCVLREYLERELHMYNLPFKYDFERAVDDWVFMCFFVGNDFLPHLPSLEIREGAIDRLVTLYKECVYKTGVCISLGLPVIPDFRYLFESFCIFRKHRDKHLRTGRSGNTVYQFKHC